MAAYVIKSWRASDQQDVHNNYVTIVGRKEGLISWVLALFGIDPTVSITVSDSRVEFSEASLSGSVRRLIPLPGICSTMYGYHKPWKRAIGVCAFVTWLTFSMFGAPSFDGGEFSLGALLGGFVVGAVLGVVYYFFNRTLTLGFIEHSGVISALQFKRSVVENQDITEDQAGYVCQLVQFLVETRHRKTLQEFH